MRWNVPQNLALSTSYELPFGKGKTFARNAGAFSNALIGGWQVQDITILRSGLPFTPTISRDIANTGVGSQRPIRNGSGKASNPTLNAWFDKSAFALPNQYTYGNSRAYILQGDMMRQFDASLFKRFVITEGSSMQFRAEFFNVSNTTSFSAPSVTTIDTTSGGKVTSTFTNPRQIQFALKYNF